MVRQERVSLPEDAEDVTTDADQGGNPATDDEQERHATPGAGADDGA